MAGDGYSDGTYSDASYSGSEESEEEEEGWRRTTARRSTGARVFRPRPGGAGPTSSESLAAGRLWSSVTRSDDSSGDDDGSTSDGSEWSDDYSGGSDSDSEGEGGQQAMEVSVPRFAKAGDVIEVRVPASAGGGTISTRVPDGLDEGDTFEVDLSGVVRAS